MAESLITPSVVRLVNNRNVENGGGQPPGGDIEERLENIEEFVREARDRLTKIETRLDGVNENMATKADLHESNVSLIKWTVGTALTLGAAAITLIAFVLNNAIPKSPSAQTNPIIINVPSVPQVSSVPSQLFEPLKPKQK